VIPSRVMLDVPAQLLHYLSRLPAAERRHRGTPVGSRKLTCRDQAVPALRWFRDRTRTEALGRDHGVSRATAYRYVAEAVDVLSAQAPSLPETLERAPTPGVRYVILDGKVFASDRCSEPMTSGTRVGYEGAGILTPAKRPAGNQELDPGTRTRNALPRDLRYRGERGLALLTQRVSCPPARHRRPPPHHRDDPCRPCPHPVRAQAHQLKLAEVASLV